MGSIKRKYRKDLARYEVEIEADRVLIIQHTPGACGLAMYIEHEVLQAIARDAYNDAKSLGGPEA